MNDRQPTKPNRIKITFDDGTIKYGYMERADEPTVEGTPLNKANLFNSNNSDRYACDVPSEAFNLLAQDVLVAVPVSGWSAAVNSEGYYTQTVNVAGMSSKYSPIFALEIGSADTVSDLQKAFSLIPRAVTGNGTITFLATDIPEKNITIRLKGV